jgi:hypothetical protein
LEKRVNGRNYGTVTAIKAIFIEDAVGYDSSSKNKYMSRA